MSSQKSYKKSRAHFLLRASASALLAGGAMTMGAYAQDVDTVPDADDAAASSGDTIVVTGSRLRKDTFNSPSPLTVLDAEAGRQIGVSNIGELLQRSPVTNGRQIDATLNANAGNFNATEAPPAGGTGSTNIDLRGLGPERTLVLLNGRRLAATGVRGAPSQPDIGLIPFSIVESAEVVTEAGSSIYGADAVAGTVNILLRDDFEGLEFSASGEVPEGKGGTQYSIGFLAGAQGERARIVFAGEYYDRERITARDRPGGDSFDNIEVDQQGNIFVSPRQGFLDALVVDGPFNFITCFQEGAPGDPTDPNVPENFIDCADVPVPAGFRDLGNSNFGYSNLYNDNFERGAADLVQPLERLSLLTNGSVDLDWFGTNNQFYFEAFYFNRQNFTIGATEQIAPTVRGMIDVRDAMGNVTGQIDNPLNPFPVNASPILTLEDLPQTFDTELQQVRTVTGMRGEFAGGWLAENDWRWDAYFSYDRGTGFVSQPILFEPHLAQSLNYYQNADGDIVCDAIGADVPNDLGQLSPPDCVVFDIFASSNFFGGANGDGVLPSDELRNYLTGDRTNRTVIEQYVASAFFDGDLFDISGGGTVTMGFGYEYREDIIKSQNGLLGVQGLNSAENPVPEGNTAGRRHFHELFAEIDVPLVVGKPGIELLSVDGAARYTSESNFGDDITYRGRLQYRPVDWFGISGGYGTSFRAPNLREQFLADQGGGLAATVDPCRDPQIQAAINASPQGDADPGIQFTIANCIADGLNFTDSDMNGNLDTTITGQGLGTTVGTISGGNPDLEPETSRTYTITASMSQPWTESFGLDLAVSYFDVLIKNSVEEPGAGIILGGCYSDPDFPGLTSPFCSLVTRNLNAPEINRQVNRIDLTFFNIGEITAKGLDFTSRFNMDLPFNIGGEPVNWSLNHTTSWQLEQERETFSPADRDDNIGEIGRPKLRTTIGSAFVWGDWSLLSEHRRIGAQENDIAENGPRDFNLNPLVVLPDGTRPITREVQFTNVVWYHDVALSYQKENYSISLGVNNIADKQPPQIDALRTDTNRNNIVTSAGYDLFGRSYFVNGRVSF